MTVVAEVLFAGTLALFQKRFAVVLISIVLWEGRKIQVVFLLLLGGEEPW